MTSTEPQVADNGQYSITEAGRHLNLSFKTVKKYTDEGALKCKIHKATGKKLYSGSELKKFWRKTY